MAGLQARRRNPESHPTSEYKGERLSVARVEVGTRCVARQVGAELRPHLYGAAGGEAVTDWGRGAAPRRPEFYCQKRVRAPTAICRFPPGSSCAEPPDRVPKPPGPEPLKRPVSKKPFGSRN